MIPSTLAEVQRRIQANEGCRLTRYLDTVGVPTIAYGWNMHRGDTRAVLQQVGVHDVEGVMNGSASLTQAQADAMFAHDLPTYIGYARGSLAPGIFDALEPARQCVIVDLAYNLGEAGWGRWGQAEGFNTTRGIIVQAQQAKASGKLDAAHLLFTSAAAHLAATAWDGQVHDRAKRDEAMMRSGVFVDPHGDGSR